MIDNPSGAPRRPAPSVLVVDDDEEIRDVVALILSEAGYHVRSASGGAEALASLRIVGPVDLVLLDLRMPGMDGEAVVVELRRDRDLRSIPVIISSGSGDGPVLHRRLGTAAYVPKPFDVRLLLATVARLCRSEHTGAPSGPGRSCETSAGP